MRKSLADKHIRGSGIEIGALHFPWPVPAGAKVHYIDRLSLEELIRTCPDVQPKNLFHSIDNAETLATVKDESQDFILNSHVFEHTEDPIGTMKNWLRVLKPGGIVLAAVPEKTQTFDRERAVTTLAHLIEDHLEGPKLSAREHYRDWFSKVDKLAGDVLEAKVEAAFQNSENIHFHVWDAAAMTEMFQWMSALGFRILESHMGGHEMFWVLQKV